MKKFFGLSIAGVVVASCLALTSCKFISSASTQDVRKIYPAEQQREIEAATKGASVVRVADKPAKVEKPATLTTPKVEPQKVQPKKEEPKKEQPAKVEPKKEEVKSNPSSAEDFDKKMKEYGLVDIQTLDNTILVELKYATTDNFVGKNMYGQLKRAYLNPAFAKRVVKAQRILRQRHPNYTLLIYDAARPISVQRTMRKMVEGTPLQDFVASGTRGGRHNYGVAVDVTIANEKGEALDMGTGFDALEDASAVKGTSDNNDPTTRTMEVYTKYIRELQASGAISKKAADNRILLIGVMHEVGLYPYRREWWHFELIDAMSTVRENYRLLDF